MKVPPTDSALKNSQLNVTVVAPAGIGMRTSEATGLRGRGRGPPEGTLIAVVPVPPFAPMRKYCRPAVGNPHEAVAWTPVSVDRLFEATPSQLEAGSVGTVPSGAHSKPAWAKTGLAQTETARNNKQVRMK